MPYALSYERSAAEGTNEETRMNLQVNAPKQTATIAIIHLLLLLTTLRGRTTALCARFDRMGPFA
jgi:hypothetical protein